MVKKIVSLVLIIVLIVPNLLQVRVEASVESSHNRSLHLTKAFAYFGLPNYIQTMLLACEKTVHVANSNPPKTVVATTQALESSKNQQNPTVVEKTKTESSQNKAPTPAKNIPVASKPTAEEKNDSTKNKVISTNEESNVTNPTMLKGILIVNKKYALPSSYAPGESAEARSHFVKMAGAVKNEMGITLKAFSTYRSFTYQEKLFNRYVNQYGYNEAVKFSAKAGQSEHQTGLAFDVGEVGKESIWTSVKFGDTEGGKWIAQNAHQYGFIVRYPKGKEQITGYQYEPWHLRYLGIDIATKIYNSGLTLEEYLGVH